MATLYHYLLRLGSALRLCDSLPKLLGISGGIALVVGTCGSVLAEPASATRCIGDAAQKPMDRGFIALLFLTAPAAWR